jgi:erythromycin esterase-like protein
MRAMQRMSTSGTLETLRNSRVDLTGGTRDYDRVIEAARRADFVLIGEASHGTHEFYLERARITQRLVRELGFNAVAVEADWPDAYRANAYVRCLSTDATADEALTGFKRFPTWMWRNRVVEQFIQWMRKHNESTPLERHVGFYGMDLYSLHTSVDAVLKYLDRTDPDEAKKARERYACFGTYGGDPQAYGYMAARSPSASCEQVAVRQLLELREHATEYTSRDSKRAADEFFYAEQNARLVKNAEEYYRTMFRGGVSSWNLRDRHMVETLYALRDHLHAQGTPRPRIVVWAHNSHLGDARATQMGTWGEWNVGQLVRERSGPAALNVGFSTYSGTVTAATEWDEPPQLKRVRPGLAGSYERLFHDVNSPRFLLGLREPDVRAALDQARLERAIGVIYRPETERQSHYFDAVLADQFDFIIHVDETHALEPMEYGEHWTGGEAPETYPTGI